MKLDTDTAEYQRLMRVRDRLHRNALTEKEVEFETVAVHDDPVPHQVRRAA